MIKLRLPIEPQSKQRPRAGRGKVYTPSKTRIFEARIKQLTKHLKPIDGPVTIKATFVFRRPKKMSKKQVGRQPRLGVPDVDNLLKALCDGLQGRAVTNDSSFVEVTGTKLYGALGEEPCIEIVITPYKIDESSLRARAIDSPKSRILEALENGETQAAAITQGLISPATFYRWRKEDEAFDQEVHEAILRGEIELLQSLQNAGEEKSDWRAFAWLLEKRFPESYGRSPALVITRNDSALEEIKEVEAELRLLNQL